MESAVFTTLCMITDENGNVLVQERRGVKWKGLAFEDNSKSEFYYYNDSDRWEIF